MTTSWECEVLLIHEHFPYRFLANDGQCCPGKDNDRQVVDPGLSPIQPYNITFDWLFWMVIIMIFLS